MKRAIDLTLVFIAAPLALVVCCLIAVVLWSANGRPVIYAQTRPGKDGRPFKMVKFRTMTQQVDHEGDLLPDADRLTRVGKWLRQTSLDELPELWNVLVGDMSLVGPRPLLMEYLDLYTPEQFRRHEVKPGISGWAQVNGRNALSWSEKFELDVWYVDHRSTSLDIKILFMTCTRVLKRTGIAADGEATMTKFSGEV